jgi:hypothetical protein
MSVQAVIRDGSPHWYLSPDIWVVPGGDPSAPPGSPIAGQPAYLWARVGNTGKTDANNIRVDFYWANPALQVTRSNATLVGSAQANVAAGSTQDVLCLVPWSPKIVNDGHECLIAVANHPGDPLPSPLPDAFDPPTYRQVAQKNLSVLVAKMQARLITITLSGLLRVDKSATISVEIGGQIDADTLNELGLRGYRQAQKTCIEAGLDRERRCVEGRDPIGDCKLEMQLPRGTSAALYLNIRAKGLSLNEYQMVRVEERSGDKVVGGLGVLVVANKEETKEQQL